MLINEGEGNLPEPSKAKADQIRTLDKSRFIKLIGTVEIERLYQIEKVIKIHLDSN